MRASLEATGLLARRLIAAASAILFATGTGVLAAETPAAAPETEGFAIYSKAIATWAAMPEPPYLAYVVIARARHRGRIKRSEELRVLFRTADRSGVTQSLRNPTALKSTTFGKPRFLPDAAFRLVPRVAGTFDANLESTTGAESAKAPLRTIGGVVARARRYAVDLVGEETYHDNRVFHLRLQPLSNPTVNTVREMWVDTQTFVTWKLVEEAWYGVGPARGHFLLNVEYAPVAHTWLIDRVTTSGSFRFGFLAYGGDAELVFSEITTPASIPNSCFTRDGFAGHQAECNALFPSTPKPDATTH